MAPSDGAQGGAIELPERRGLARVFPFLDDLRGYRGGDLARDLLAAVLVTVLLVPQAMAYALLADLPPQVGLYAAVLPAALYALLGTSRHLAVGPVALVSLLTAEALADVGADGLAPATVAITLAALVGLLLLVMGLLGGGFLIRFISEPVLTGFAAAAALLIAFSQLPNLLGLAVERHESFVDRFLDLVPRVPEADPATLLMGAAAFALLIAADRLAGPILSRFGIARGRRLLLANATPLLTVAGGTLLVATLGLPVDVVGEVPGGLPPLTLPALEPELWLDLLPSALAIALVSFVTSVAIARKLERPGAEGTAGEDAESGDRPGNGRVEPNRELIALGTAGLGAALTGGYPVGGSISRSALAADVGARSPLAAVMTGGLALLAAVVAAPLLADLPKAVLAAIIMTAVVGLVDVAAVRRTWRSSPEDGVALAVTFIAVLAFGVAEGIGIGAVAGIAIYLWRTSRPRVVVQGRVEGSEEFRSVERGDVEEEDGSPVVVVRVDQDLYFANAEHIENEVLTRLASRSGICCTVLDLRGVNELDASALEALNRLADALEEAGIELCLSEVKRQVSERLELDGLLGALGEGRVFVSTSEAVEEMEKKYGE